MSCLSNTEVCTPWIKLFWLTEAKSGIFDQKSGTRPEKAGRMVTLHLLQVNTCYGHKMLSFAGVKLWSKLDPDLKSLGWLSFKKHFKRKLLQKYDD